MRGHRRVARRVCPHDHIIKHTAFLMLSKITSRRDASSRCLEFANHRDCCLEFFHLLDHVIAHISKQAGNRHWRQIFRRFVNMTLLNQFLDDLRVASSFSTPLAIS